MILELLLAHQVSNKITHAEIPKKTGRKSKIQSLKRSGAYWAIMLQIEIIITIADLASLSRILADESPIQKFTFLQRYYSSLPFSNNHIHSKWSRSH